MARLAAVLEILDIEGALEDLLETLVTGAALIAALALETDAFLLEILVTEAALETAGALLEMLDTGVTTTCELVIDELPGGSSGLALRLMALALRIELAVTIELALAKLPPAAGGGVALLPLPPQALKAAASKIAEISLEKTGKADNCIRHPASDCYS